MNPTTIAVMVTISLCLTPLLARDLNFYVPDTLPETEETSAQSEKSEPKADATNTKREKIEESSTKERAGELYTFAQLKAESTSKEPPKPANTPAAITKIDERIRSMRVTKDFDPELDPFGIAAAFQSRWDYSSFLITAKEELRFRTNAVRSRTLRLARAFSALSEEVATRQRNLNTAALAVYLLSRDQQSWYPVEGRNLTEAQLLAVRATMRQDIDAMHSALADYETLRNALNSSAEEVELLDKNGLPSRQAGSNPYAITQPAAQLAAENTKAVLQERVISVEALKAALATEMLRNNAQRRQSIASFAPPPPGISKPPSGLSSTPPKLPSMDVMKQQPLGEKMDQPERSSTLVIDTKINAPVYTAREGIVVYAGPFRGHGNMVIIEHQKGVFSVYSHMATIQVLEREPVKSGAIIGRAGNLPEIGRSGIHFQVRNGKTPVKPEQWLGTDQVARLITKQ